MPDTPTIPPKTYEAQWAQWPMTALERIRLPYPWIVVLMALLGTASVALDTALRYHLRGVWPACDVAFGVSSVVVSVYILVYTADSSSGHQVGPWHNSDPRCRSAIEEYESYVRRFLHAGGSVEVLLIGLAVLLVVFFWYCRPTSYVDCRTRPRSNYRGVVVIALYWTVLFYLLLSLVYISIRNARALGDWRGGRWRSTCSIRSDCCLSAGSA